MKKIILPILLILLASCGAVRVNYDYSQETDFSVYTTYDYYPDMDTGLSQLDTKRLLRVVDSVMQIRGFSISDQPDFYINIQSSVYRDATSSSVGVGMGGTGRNVGGGISVGVPLGGSGITREIVFDFVDADRDALFWQAVSNSNYRENASPSTRERVLREVVAKVFSKYPPSK
ncbi:DUF4136 domain-containing protein [Lentiprolixibacter aurantiacus]|uniref:DUF4136 domain-containing protein n=1 Tax=Lentiprolixibacter aurantiacus TaxID=2993939 RepID=A0AAE3MPS6_9FLAO|nr:DUF4136 domain-containing protein [Lentiprolixibacter aurantiacus]MCX2720712.1 DUF4136 domain-containing protein [Lentiprolixibacter aurantiacus]